MNIAAKESRETHYRLRLARDGKILSMKESSALLGKIESIRKILTSIVKSTD
jgi:four helix bundle protein